MTLGVKPATSKPGEFKAHCRLVEFKTAQQMTPEQHATATAAGETSRWDNKAKAEVWTIWCDETFDDAATFDRHMAEQHPTRSPWTSNSLEPRQYNKKVQNHSMPMSIPVRLWKGPRAAKDGTEFVDKAGRTVVCSACGTVVETDFPGTVPMHGCPATSAGAA